MLSMGVYSNKSVRKGVGHPRISFQDLGFRKNKDFLLEYTPMIAELRDNSYSSYWRATCTE